jgi:hypothetical protein
LNEIGLMVLEKMFKIFQCIFAASLISFLGTNLNPHHLKSSSGSGEEVENVKSLQTDRYMDNRERVISKAHLRLNELTTKVIRRIDNMFRI